MTDHLKKNFALTMIILIGALIFYMSIDFLKSIGIAIILAFLTNPIYNYFYKKTKSKNFSSGFVVFLVLIILILPLTSIAGFILGQVDNFSINENNIQNFEKATFEITGKEVSIKKGFIYLENKIKSEFELILQKTISITSDFMFNLFIIFFVLFYLLIDKKIFLKHFISMLPFSTKNSKHLIEEGEKVTKAVLIGQVITAIAQGLLGMLAFFIAGIDNAFLWGLLMILFSIIPIVGAFLIWVPTGIFLIVTNEVGMGIFILVWGTLVISQIDNFLRPKLIGKFANIHPLETFIGIFMGLSFFGMIGIIIGPLIISLFNTLIKVYKKEYSEDEEFRL